MHDDSRLAISLRPTDEEEWWEKHSDEAASIRHCGGGLVLTSPERFKIYYSLVYRFKTSNNGAEYEVVIARLWLVDSLKVRKLMIKINSRLVVGQLNSNFDAKEKMMILYKDVTEG